MKTAVMIRIATVVAVLVWAGCGGARDKEHAHEGEAVHGESSHSDEAHGDEAAHAGEHAGEHEGEEEGAHEGEEAGAHEGEEAGAHEGEHEGEEAGAHAGEDEHAGEIVVTPEGMKMAGITTATAQMGTISQLLELSGEIAFNADRVVHITPRFGGIVTEVAYGIGDYVRAGEIVARIESNESMSGYALKAPFAGRIIEKHAAVGEHVSAEQSIFMIADLSTVWANLAVYPNDASRVAPGQKVTIMAVGTEAVSSATLGYITPVVDAQTRTITARVVLPNRDNRWRPGTFVKASVALGGGRTGVVVARDAVQTLDNERVVFVQHEPGRFKAVVVTTGEHNGQQIVIESGLASGQQYVSGGAFELKAKIVTSSLGAHAGHGH